MTFTIELHACSESGTSVAYTVPDAALPAELSVRLARAFALVAARLPRPVEAGDIVVAEGGRYFVTARGFRAVPAGYQPTLSDLLVGFPDAPADALQGARGLPGLRGSCTVPHRSTRSP